MAAEARRRHRSTPSEDLGGGIARNAAFAFAMQASGAIFTAGLTIFLVRALEPSGYGTLALAIAIGGIALLFSDAGVSQATARFVAENRGRQEATATVIRDALWLKLAVATLVSAILVALAGPIAAAYEVPGLAWPLRVVGIAVLGQSIMFMFATFVAIGRTELNLYLALLESATETATTVALIVLGAGVTGAAVGRAAGYAVAAVGTIVLLSRVFRFLATRHSSRHVGRRELAGYAGALAIVDGAFGIFNQLDVLLIGALLSTTAVGQFQAPLRLIPLLGYPGTAIAHGVGPRLARREGRAPDAEGLARSLRYLLLFQAALVPPILVWAGPIVELLLGPDYGDSEGVLRAFAPYVFLGGISPVLALSVNYLGVARRRIVIVLVAVAVNAAIDLALIPRIGIVAGAVGTDVAYTLYAAGHLAICKRELDLPLRPLAIAAAQGAVAAGAMAAVLLAFGTSDLSPPEWVGGALFGSAAFLGVLLLLKAVSRRELERARVAVARPLRRRAS